MTGVVTRARTIRMRAGAGVDVHRGVLAAFLVLAGAFVVAKGWLDGDVWTDLARQALLAVAAATVVYVVTDRPPLVDFSRMIGLRPLVVDVGPARRAAAWAVVPLLVSVAAVTVAATVFDFEVYLTRERLVDLVVVVAFGEELLYRGLLLVIAYKAVGRWRGELATAMAFALWHVPDALGDSAGGSIGWRVATLAVQLVVTAAGGLMFSWMRHRTRTLAGPVGLHIATNLPGRVFALG